METLLALEMVGVTEAAAIASARLMGRGDRHSADRAAVEAMRSTLEDVEVNGTIVIGEGERDEAPMLYIGERVGKDGAEDVPRVDIAVDPLEGTNLVAHGQAGAITVLAASEAGGLTHAPDTYMEKICVGPVAAGKVDVRDTPTGNLRHIAEALGRRVQDITVLVREVDPVVPALEQRDVRDVGVEESPHLLADEFEQRRDIELSGKLLRDCVDRVELGGALLRFGEEARVLDRHRCLQREAD